METKKMDRKQFAKLLDGRQYRNEMTKEEEKLAEENGLLVIFGASDDLLEFRGLISEELSAYDGCNAFIVKNKNQEIEILTDSKFNKKFNEQEEFLFFVKIIAVFAPKDIDYTWFITSPVENSSFDIFDGNDLFCRGIVIDKATIEKIINPNKEIQKESAWDKSYPDFIKKAYLSKNPEQTKSRLMQMVDIGMTEVGYGNFGINGLTSGLYIEMIWNYSDSDFQSYIDWVKDLIKENEEISFTLEDGSVIKNYDIIEYKEKKYKLIIENTKPYLICIQNSVIDGLEMQNIIKNSKKIEI